tara:strand:- start:962 stop:2032 length:1071 start_codon:yes stop_codon:yes gene_type:complete
MNKQQVIETFKRYGLKPKVSRPLNLFMMSAVPVAYIELMPGKVNFSYEAVATIGNKNNETVYFNEEHIISKTEELIDSSQNIVEEIINPAFSDFLKIQEEIKVIKTLGPKEIIKRIIQIYPHYFLRLGIMNNFMRYLGDNESKGKLTKDIVNEIAKKRDTIAKEYEKIEDMSSEAFDVIGFEWMINSELLKYATLNEMNKCLEQNSADHLIKELEQRMKSYLLLSVGKEDHLIIDKETIENVQDLEKVNIENTKEIKGNIAFSGEVDGIVYNAVTHPVEKIPENAILVTTMTFAHDSNHISKAAALITDEGNYLSHAAIIARELKMPCVISTKYSTKILKTGDKVKIKDNVIEKVS